MSLLAITIMTTQIQERDKRAVGAEDGLCLVFEVDFEG